MTVRQHINNVRGVVILVALLVVALPIVMAALVMGSASFTCSSVTFSFSNDSNPESWDFAIVRVTNLSTSTIIYYNDAAVDPWGDDSPYIVDYAPQPTGSILELEIQVDTRNVSAQGVCTGSDFSSPLAPSGSTPQCQDERINKYNCEPVAIYPVKTDAGYDLVVYRITSTGQGLWLFSVSAPDLTALPSHPDTPLLVAADPNGFAELYWLPSNEYQIIAGPDAEGKMFKFIFRQFPGEEPRLITYMAGEA